MTRKQVQDQITLNLNDARTNTVTQILNCLDIVLRYMVMKLEISSRIYDGFIRTTSGRMQYSLHPEARQVQGKFYIPESDVYLEDMSPDDFNEVYPSPDSTDIPYVSMLSESFPVSQQPHSKVRFVSDSASDTQAVTIYGQSYGRYLSEAVTLTGTTAVLTTNAYQKVYRLVAASAAVGTITATANSTSGDTTLPTVAGAGSMTVGTIVATATESANVVNPGAFLRISMSDDDAADRAGASESVRIEGIAVSPSVGRDDLLAAETVLINQSDTTTVVLTVNSYSEVRIVSKSWDSAKRLRITTDPGNICIVDIDGRRRSQEYQQARFYNIPDGKTIQYRYTPGYMKLDADSDNLSDVVPEVYHQIVAEWTEKLVRGIHGDMKLGIPTLENNPGFDRAVREIKQSSRSSTSSTLVVGSNWNRRGIKRPDRVFPIVHSTN